jgi:hypothetical protein
VHRLLVQVTGLQYGYAFVYYSPSPEGALAALIAASTVTGDNLISLRCQASRKLIEQFKTTPETSWSTAAVICARPARSIIATSTPALVQGGGRAARTSRRASGSTTTAATGISSNTAAAEENTRANKYSTRNPPAAASFPLLSTRPLDKNHSSKSMVMSPPSTAAGGDPVSSAGATASSPFVAYSSSPPYQHSPGTTAIAPVVAKATAVGAPPANDKHQESSFSSSYTATKSYHDDHSIMARLKEEHEEACGCLEPPPPPAQSPFFFSYDSHHPCWSYYGAGGHDQQTATGSTSPFLLPLGDCHTIAPVVIPSTFPTAAVTIPPAGGGGTYSSYDFSPWPHSPCLSTRSTISANPLVGVEVLYPPPFVVVYRHDGVGSQQTSAVPAPPLQPPLVRIRTAVPQQLLQTMTITTTSSVPPEGTSSILAGAAPGMLHHHFKDPPLFFVNGAFLF